jgi:hypothetical protein
VLVLGIGPVAEADNFFEEAEKPAAAFALHLGQRIGDVDIHGALDQEERGGAKLALLANDIAPIEAAQHGGSQGVIFQEPRGNLTERRQIFHQVLNPERLASGQFFRGFAHVPRV